MTYSRSPDLAQASPTETNASAPEKSASDIFGRAYWIWPGLAFHDLHNCFAQFRRTFKLDAVPDVAPCYLTADQKYRLRVNGRLVCRGPARGYQRSWPYDEVEISPFLKEGKNVLSVQAFNGGTGTFSYRTEGFAGFLFAARIGGQKIVSDRTWRCRRQPGIRKDTAPYSFQLGSFQEHIDLNASDPDWESVEFDDREWVESEELRIWNALPFFSLEPRGLPNMAEFSRDFTLCGSSAGKSAAGWREADDVAAIYAQEDLSHQLSESLGAITQVPKTQAGQFRRYLFDLGRVEVGSIRLTVRGCQGGEVLDLLHSEVIDSVSLAPHVDRSDYCRVRMANRMVCRAGKQSHSFFHALGFRYVSVTVRENRAPLRISLELEACRYPLERMGGFESPEPELQRIWEACAHTQEICALDAYVDTPWREQAQWWGDARIQGWNTFHLSGDTRLLRRGIRIMAGQLTPDGLTYGHAPTIAHSCVLPDFALIWILTLWDDYWQTGETIMFERHRETVFGILAYFKDHTDPATGLVRYDPRYWLFLDWNDLQKEGQPTLLSLWLLYTLQKLSTLLKATSLEGELPEVDEWCDRLASSIGKQLLGRNGLVCDGLDDEGKPSDLCSIHCQTLAWLCEIDGFDKGRALQGVLLPWLCEDRVSHASPSAYWCAYTLDLLAENGYGAEVLAFIRRHWKRMGEFGSCFENFDTRPEGSDVLSHSHAWSAHPLYLLMRILGGVRQIAPGWERVRIDRTYTGCTAKISIPSPKGLIETAWERGPAGEPVLNMEIPDEIAVE